MIAGLLAYECVAQQVEQVCDHMCALPWQCHPNSQLKTYVVAALLANQCVSIIFQPVVFLHDSVNTAAHQPTPLNPACAAAAAAAGELVFALAAWQRIY